MINTLMLKAIVSAQNGIARLRDEEEAQTLTEYALIIAVIAIGVLVALYFLRDQIKDLFSKTGSSITAIDTAGRGGEARLSLLEPRARRFNDTTAIRLRGGEPQMNDLALRLIVAAQNGIRAAAR